MSEYRYRKQIKMCCTEVGNYSADFAYIKNGALYEVEIKISLSDFKSDFKKRKHKLYESERYSLFKPNYFYYAVPVSLLPKITPILINYPKYGIIVIKEDDTHRFNRNFSNTKIVKTAKILHSYYVPDKVTEKFISRMTSEIATFWKNKVRG
jgi:hypothetical protein